MGKYLTGRMIIKSFGNSTDHSGEVEGYCDFEFKLVEPIRVSYGGRSYMYDRMKFTATTWTSPLYFVGPNKQFADMGVPKSMIQEAYDILTKLENGKGKLKDWCFSDQLYQMLEGKSNA